MTPFEYDAYPFQDNPPQNFQDAIWGGAPSTDADAYWDVDGNIATNENPTTGTKFRKVVWGCERPELLFTESLAYHNRNTVDKDEIDKKTTGNANANDNDEEFDQVLDVVYTDDVSEGRSVSLSERIGAGAGQ